MTLPFAISYSLLVVEKRQIKRQVKWKMIAGIDRDELVLLSFSKNEIKTKLRWEHSKEFEYLGEMYDIVEEYQSLDSTHYICWWDSEETILNKRLAKLINKEINSNHVHRDKYNKIINLQILLFCNQMPKSNVFLPLSDGISSLNNFENNYCSINVSPPDPPPKNV